MANVSVTNTFTNGTTADASQVNQNFTDIINGTSDGTKDFSISALTVGGTFTANGNVTLGNSSSDDLTVTASLASTIPIKTTNTYDIGSTTLGLRALYFGANSQTVNIKGSSSMSATWTMTLPVSAGTSRYRLETDGAGVTSWVKSFTSSSDIRNASLAVSLSGNAMTVALKGADGNDPSTTNPVTIVFRSATATTGTLSEVVVTSALSVTVSSGSTLGTVSAIQSKINVYAINNAGTVELAIANLGATSTDGRISTTAEGGAGAADSATVFYSTTARSNVACRLLGAVVSTQATAGTWATAITSILTVGCGMVLTSAMTDWIAYTPTIANLGTGSATATGFWRRVGDSAEVQVRIVKDGSTGSGSSTVTATFDTGIVPDTAKITTNTAQLALGTWSAYGIKGSNTNQEGTIWLSSFLISFSNPGDASGNTLFGSNMTANSYLSSNNIRVPVQGWFARDWMVG